LLGIADLKPGEAEKIRKRSPNWAELTHTGIQNMLELEKVR
jgi:hypothetical protein